LGGNATVIGASANVTATGLAERAGERISFREFAAFGMPVATVSLVVSAVALITMTFASWFVEDGVMIAAGALLLLLRMRAGRATAA
jgi:hypothetical protein